MKEIYNFKNYLSSPLVDDVLQVPKINYNVKYFQQILKKHSKNRSRDNTLSSASVMELIYNRDERFSVIITIERENKVMTLSQLSM